MDEENNYRNFGEKFCLIINMDVHHAIGCVTFAQGQLMSLKQSLATLPIKEYPNVEWE